MELQTIQKKIYEIRGKQVMLDFDLAALYGVETKVLKQGVAMLSSILNSETAIEVNISIIRAFVSIRQYLSVTNNPIKEIEDLKQRMKALEEGTEDTIAAINDLSEDTRKELDDIYLALSQLADKQKQITRKSERKPIGLAQYKKEDKS